MPSESLPLEILVVDDQPEVVQVIRRGLEQEGHHVDHASSGEEGLERIGVGSYDIVILDVMLPGLNGFEVAQRIRDPGITTPILMLTQRDTERDIIHGLELGADAYLAKPFRLGELRAHLRALRRRVGMEARTILRFDDVELDRVRREVKRGGHEVPLTNIEFKLLETLMLRPGRTFAKEELLRMVWGLTFDPGTGVLNVHLGNLRAKLEEASARRIIQTIRGKGYCLSTEEP
jgi:DNA-binding response OmpR family regulator